MAKEILINQLFAGKYLNEEENIGHEVINLFKDDEGKNNLFITHNGRVSGHDIEYIIFVRNYSAKKTVEVIGLAEGIHTIADEEMKQVRYAGVSLDQIFSKNKHRGKTDPFTQHVTFRADRMLLPNNRIFITIEDDFMVEEYTLRLNTERQVIVPQPMREYYSSELDSNAYDQLLELIHNEALWDKDNTTQKLIPDGATHVQTPSFLEVIRKEDDENIFSNLLAYYFDYSHRAFQRFAANSELLDISNFDASFDILRETMNRIDLWIESDEDIIVIENKIKSGINGVTGDDYSQLNKYIETAEEEAKKKNKKPHYYIFAPDYAKFDLAKYGVRDVYKVIKYSDIYNFFVRETETYIGEKNFPDFIRGLKRHTLTFPELQFATMRARLLNRINRLQ